MNERGSITLWMVGLVMVVFVLGGVSVDLWRGLSTHRAVATVVDSAAVAAGSGIDEASWRDGGVLRLSPAEVDRRVGSVVAAHDIDGLVVTVSVDPDGATATVRGWRTIDLTLLSLVVDGGLEASATATAVPVLSP